MAQNKLIITPKAIDDIQKAVDYYNSKQGGLGKRFYTDLQQQFKIIKQNPEYKSVRYAHIRLAHLEKFPYAAHYFPENNNVIINAVLCDYQNQNG